MDHLSIATVKQAHDACFSLEEKEDPHPPAGNLKSDVSQTSSGLLR